MAEWLGDAWQLFPGRAIGVDGEPPNSAIVTDNNVLVIRVRGDRERFSFHARSLNWRVLCCEVIQCGFSYQARFQSTNGVAKGLRSVPFAVVLAACREHLFPCAWKFRVTLNSISVAGVAHFEPTEEGLGIAHLETEPVLFVFKIFCQ